MYSSKLSIICVILASIMLSGCVGMGILEPKECHLSSPTTSSPMFSIKYLFVNRPTKPSTKEEFLSDWGKPDKIAVTLDNKELVEDGDALDKSITIFETWVYKRHLWCGIIPAVIIPIPLILPVCDGFDEIIFKGDEAYYLNTKRSRLTGCYLPGGCGSDPCWPQSLQQKEIIR